MVFPQRICHPFKISSKNAETSSVVSLLRGFFSHQIFDRLNISSTYVYSTLDASARKINVAKFRADKASILLVTDLAARGIDIPILDNVVNFNFPPKAKLFVHRVGRVARGVRSGTAYSFVSPDEVCYLLDLHMFLNSSIRFCPSLSQPKAETGDGNMDRLYGSVPQDIIDDNADCINKMLSLSHDLVRSFRLRRRLIAFTQRAA